MGVVAQLYWPYNLWVLISGVESSSYIFLLGLKDSVCQNEENEEK